MTAFADTSALYALVDADDTYHDRAHDLWHTLAVDDVVVTTQLVVVETTALVQRRLGHEAAAELHRAVLAGTDVLALDEGQFGRAVERWAAHGRRRLSLVDVTSFVVMEDRGIDVAFAIDDDFRTAGFDTLLG